MVPVGMTDEQNFCILEFESELFDAGFDHRHIRFQVTINQDVPLRRCYEIVREPLTTNVIQIARYAKRRKWLRPVRAVLCKRGVRER
jgi:uncharacterized protein YdhG (YjbR/CyaY superfamily)